MRTVVVIPCHNEAATIAEVIKAALPHVDEVVVADDNSDDATALIAVDMGAQVVRNRSCCRGAGVNTKRGMDSVSADVVITLDGDGQHLANEIPTVLKPLLDGDADLVIGSRFMGEYKIARYRKFGIDAITWIYNLGRRPKILDTQSCFRAYGRRFLETFDIKERGFGFSTEVLIKARAEGLRIIEVPISCVYHEDFAQNSCMNPIKHGLGVAWTTIKWRLKMELFGKLKHQAVRQGEE